MIFESKLRSVTRLLKGEAGFEARSILMVDRGAAQIIDGYTKHIPTNATWSALH
jgi:hypothetical protein